MYLVQIGAPSSLDIQKRISSQNGEQREEHRVVHSIILNLDSGLVPVDPGGLVCFSSQGILRDNLMTAIQNFLLHTN